MDNSNPITKPNPRETASVISILSFWWTIDIFKRGKKIFGPGDLCEPMKVDKSNSLGDRLEIQWNIEKEKATRNGRTPDLLRAIGRTFSHEFFILGCIHFFNEFILRLGTPIFLGELLEYFKPEASTSYREALFYASAISIATILTVITANQVLFGAYDMGSKMRIAICSLIYRKALRLSKTALGETAPGKVVNLLANDVSRFEWVSIFIHHMWSAPLTALVISIVLCYKAGYTGVTGILVIILVVSIQVYTSKLTAKYREQTAVKTDERVRFMNEIISGVQVIKMYAWEKPFCALIERARQLELQIVKKNSYIRGIYMSISLGTTHLALYCTILAMLFLTNERPTAEKIYVFYAYYNILLQSMSGKFGLGVADIAECKVAARRLQAFLAHEEFQHGNVNNLPMSGVNGKLPLGSNASKSQHSNPIDKDEVPSELNSLLKSDRDFAANQLINRDTQNDRDNTQSKWGVKINSVTAKWDLYSTDTVLEDISLQLEKGKLYIVIGSVGSGKSSLLSTILGEVDIVRGTVKVNGKISYADQECWVFGASVRQNILFGQPFDKRRYQRVIKACALQQDFDQFPQGDQTIVGERGNSLSGGQKARINLARAVYREADVYLLDDPLSAVDAHVGKHLFEECLQKYLGNKTRLLATHQIQYLKEAESIFLLEEAKLYRYNDYHELLNDHPKYRLSIASEDSHGMINTSSQTIPADYQVSSPSIESHSASAKGSETNVSQDEVSKEQTYKIEETSRGTVKGSLLLKYLGSGASWPMASFMVLLFVLTQFIASLNDLFIPILIKAEESRIFHNDSGIFGINETNWSTNRLSSMIRGKAGSLPRDSCIYIYTGIVVSILITVIARSILFFTIAMRCSQRLHDLMFGALIRASMRFFDTNPSGVILNRFSKDLGAIDELLPRAILDATQIILILIGALVVSSIVNPIFLVPIFLVSIIFYWIRKIYLATSTNIKRLEGMTRSPVFTHINATLSGLATVRANGAQGMLKEEFDKLQDVHSASWYMFFATNIAFGFSLDLCLAIFTTFVAFSFLVLKQNFTGGQVGLAITQVLAMTGRVQWGMRQSAQVTNQLTSVERVLQYAQVPPEKSSSKFASLSKKKSKVLGVEVDEQNHSIISPDTVALPKNWPSHGQIDLRSVSMRYADDYPPVLKDLTLSILPSEKIGIVGRTGAGKSSLISALFRLAKVEGVIEIDGIDTDTIALEDLRRSISIIPQDPVLFSGTLRRNLDPFNEFSDEYLWSVLEEVELKDAVTATSNGLDHRVMDRGANYSVGQRQLICLARAILRNNRILMLDEATANVDPHTDSLIQRTIRTKFSSCTVLTIAHRLNTIMDSDKVIVMDKGHVVEYDHPHILLQDHHGQFSSLVKETGHAMYEQLCEVAREAYTAKHKDTQFE